MGTHALHLESQKHVSERDTEDTLLSQPRVRGIGPGAEGLRALIRYGCDTRKEIEAE